MNSSGRLTLCGMEVPLIGSSSVKWIGLSVAVDGDVVDTPSPPYAPLTEDCGSCFTIGDPPLYLIWRIHESSPRSLEILEVSANKEFPRVGLRLTFPDSVSPFLYICRNEIGGSPSNPYLVYALTISGVAYLFKLRSISSYVSCSAFPSNEVVMVDLREFPNAAPITCMAAAAGCLVVGRNDGSVSCFRLGLVDPHAPGFVHELRDDVGISRLWGFMSRKSIDGEGRMGEIDTIDKLFTGPRNGLDQYWRVDLAYCMRCDLKGRLVGAVQDLVISEVYGFKVLFVLHFDGSLRLWSLSSHSKIFIHNTRLPDSEDATPARLWVGEANDSNLLPFAILYKYEMENSLEIIYVYSLHYSVGEKIVCSVGSSIQSIALDEGHCIDVKITPDKIWILKNNGLLVHNLFPKNGDSEGHCYSLQEDFVADQLFQSSESSPDNLLWITLSLLSSIKDNAVPFLSSIFLHRVLHPGVYHYAVLRSTLLDYNRHWTDSEFQSLTVEGLEAEIRSVVENEGSSESLALTFCNWKDFCSRYFHNWCKTNSPCGLLVQSASGAVGLVRKHSASLFRDLEDNELLIDGSSGEYVDLNSFGTDLSDASEREILSEVLRCVVGMSQQLGKTTSAIFCESLVRMPNSPYEEIIPRLLKILENGHGSRPSLSIIDYGSDFAWEKEQADHKSLRKFSIDMLLSLRALYNKATSWGKVLKVLENYLQFLVPKKDIRNCDIGMSCAINTSVLVQATSQIAKVMLECASDILLFICYLLRISWQINMSHDDVSRIQETLLPFIEDIISEWLIIHFLATKPSESPAMEDFSSQMSSLQIDGKTNNRPWNDKLGTCEFSLAHVLLMTSQTPCEDAGQHSTNRLQNPSSITKLVQGFSSWIVWGKTGEESTSFLKRATELALILIRHGQYASAECILTIVEANSRREKVSRSINETDGQWCLLQHLLGCCLLAQSRHGFQGMLKEKRVSEAIRCFFRASTGREASLAFKELSHDAGWSYVSIDEYVSPGAWKLQYYQWAMQIFEQYSISEGACQFAFAALEQVDEATRERDDSHAEEAVDESATTIKGRLWANVFKFTLDLNRLYDAYCAILSNPDEESKYICLRRFLIVLLESGGIKVVCDGQLPFIGLTEKIERELAWKAERSDIGMKPNLYKLLYAFEMHQHNWRMAAHYMYQYVNRLRNEVVSKDQQHRAMVLQERLNGLSAAINALHLVHPAYAWIDSSRSGNFVQNDCYPSKKARIALEANSASTDVQPQKLPHHIGIGKLEDEFVLTTAEYELLLAGTKWTFSGMEKPPTSLVSLLIQVDLYDMAFTVLLRFWKGSGLQRELERVFISLSLRCSPKNAGLLSSGIGDGQLLTSSMDIVIHDSADMSPTPQQSKGITQWENLENYLKMYKACHPGLPVTVAETLLRSDLQMELPLWLVNMFKESRRDKIWGFAGQESNAASLFRLYVDYGRYAEATHLLLDRIESYASVRPSDLISRKRPFSTWFPYTTIERLWCQLEEHIKMGHMADQCEKLKKLLHGALLNHLHLLKEDCDDALS